MCIIKTNMLIDYSNNKPSKSLAAILLLPFIFIAIVSMWSGILEAADSQSSLGMSQAPEAGKTGITAEDSARGYSPGEGEMGKLQKQARMYRLDGLELQRLGNLDGAMILYQKAIELDPAYAVAYNDLGVIYEAKGWMDRAEDAYLRTLRIDPNCLSAYSNLAMFYENKRELNKAAELWLKRVELGKPQDPWTEKARKRLDDLTEVIPELKQRVVEEQVADLANKVKQDKQNRKLEDAKKVQGYLDAARKLEKKSDYRQAMDEVKQALSLDHQNKEALSLSDEIKAKLKEQEQAAIVKDMQLRFQTAVSLYQQNNPQAARQELDKLKELAK